MRYNLSQFINDNVKYVHLFSYATHRKMALDVVVML